MYTIAATLSLVLVFASSVTGKDVMLRGAKLNDLETPERQLLMGNILDIASSSADLKTLANALSKAGFEDELDGPGPFTVFAPTDDAFNKLPPGTLDSLSLMRLEDILDYHIINGTAVKSSDLTLNMKPMTVEGSTLKITSLSPTVMINGVARVITADIIASNGVIHKIDTVLIPPPDVPSAESPSVESEDP
jgi:uncharacterized surface protein with fasciclin (FAS1) repeats